MLCRLRFTSPSYVEADARFLLTGDSLLGSWVDRETVVVVKDLPVKPQQSLKVGVSEHLAVGLVALFIPGNGLAVLLCHGQRWVPGDTAEDGNIPYRSRRRECTWHICSARRTFDRSLGTPSRHCLRWRTAGPCRSSEASRPRPWGRSTWQLMSGRKHESRFDEGGTLTLSQASRRMPTDPSRK